jgi:hypothetical protein
MTPEDEKLQRDPLNYRQNPNIGAFIAELVRQLDEVVRQHAEAQSRVPYAFLLDAIADLMLIWCRRMNEAAAAKGEPGVSFEPDDLRNMAVIWIEANLKYALEPKDKLQ